MNKNFGRWVEDDFLIEDREVDPEIVDEYMGKLKETLDEIQRYYPECGTKGCHNSSAWILLSTGDTLPIAYCQACAVKQSPVVYFG